MSRRTEDVLAAGLAGAVLSGVPSTAYALWRGDDLLEGALAAGTLLLPRERRPSRLLPAATVAHLALSLGWAAVLERALPARRTLPWAALAGLGIAALDLGVIGRGFPRIRALATAPQVADHLAYAVVAGAVLKGRQRRPLTASGPRDRLPG